MIDRDQVRKKILSHASPKKNGLRLAVVTHEAKMVNSTCGDQVQVQLQIRENQVLTAVYSAKACAICTASASLLCEEVEQKSVTAAMQIGKNLTASLALAPGEPWPMPLSNLECLEHLRANPSRKACALLPWIAFQKALISWPDTQPPSPPTEQ